MPRERPAHRARVEVADHRNDNVRAVAPSDEIEPFFDDSSCEVRVVEYRPYRSGRLIGIIGYEEVAAR